MSFVEDSRLLGSLLQLSYSSTRTCVRVCFDEVAWVQAFHNGRPVQLLADERARKGPWTVMALQPNCKEIIG